MNRVQLGNVYKRHRTAVLAGMVCGLVILAAWVGYEWGMTPAVPNVQQAPAEEVVAYIGNPRGLARMPQIQQEQFLQQWKDHVQKEPARSQLRECFRTLEEETRKAFSAAIMKQIKRAFLADARQFSSLTSPEDRSGFTRNKVLQYRDEALFMKDVAVGFKAPVGSRTDDAQQWVMENTTAEERAIGEPYYNALKRVRDQVRKEQTGRPPARS
jgi:hypothetical protein